ncbi:ankyrin repeat-containing domain protein [Morchella snyderi]|nr:ankyrin repeat-containing domain protein [Morchella snyderi]
MALLNFENGTILRITQYLGQKDVKSLLLTNRRLASLLTPRFYDLAVADLLSKKEYKLETVLEWAAIEGHETPIIQIAQRGGDITVRSVADDDTLLHLAVKSGHEGVVRVLLEKGGIDITAQNRVGTTALHLAADKGLEGCFRLLVAKARGEVQVKKAIGIEDHAGWTALHFAAANNHAGIVKVLIEKGADITYMNVREKTPLHLAAEKGFDLVVSLMMDAGFAADEAAGFFDRAGNMPLHSAAKNGHVAVVKRMLEKGVDCMTTTKAGATALHWAAKMGHEDVVAVLLENDASTNAVTIDERRSTPLQWVAESCCWMIIFKERDPEVILDLLLEHGSDVRAMDARGKTALHYAAENGLHTTRIKEERNTPGRAPKQLDLGNQITAQSIYKNMISLFLNGGANINARDMSDRTPFHYAVENGDEYAMRILLEKGADIEAKYKGGKTSLQAEYELEIRRENIVRILLEHGAKGVEQAQIDSKKTIVVDRTAAEPRIGGEKLKIPPSKIVRYSLIPEELGGKPKKEKEKEKEKNRSEFKLLKDRASRLLKPTGLVSRILGWRRK